MLPKVDLPDFSRAHILVCGDVMLDRYWYGDTTRISPEAPVPVVHIQDIETRPGGAANVALNIASLGAEVSLLGIVGVDAEADELQRKLSLAQVQCAFVSTQHHPTVTKLRVLSQNQQLIRLDFESSAVLEMEGEGLLAQFDEQLSSANMVILSDYAKGVLREAPKLIQRARARGIPVLVDPKSTDLNRYRGATLITPNLKEFEAMVGPCAQDDELVERARALLKQYEFGAILVTRGKQGMILIQQDEAPFNIPTYARDVYDVTGAGDTVIAVLAASLAAGSSLQEAAMMANRAAGLVVAKLGAATVSVPELRRALRQAEGRHEGILTEAELRTMVSDAKAHGESVVMTNGCFDILHAGHVQYLQQAKNLGNYLVVAVNDDASVRRLKGSERPLNSLIERMQVLAALEAVDAVVSFSEDTPARLYETILPSILVKGGDYTVEHIAGAEAVINSGGKVEVLSFKDGCSTSALIDKIRKK